MKKIYLAFPALFGLLTCCNSNDENSGLQVSADQLLGKWHYETQYITWNGTGTSFDPIPYEGNLTGCEKDYFLFNEDGTGIERDYNDEACSFLDSDKTWNINGDELTVFEESGVLFGIYKVTDITAETLKIVATTDDGFIVQKTTLAFSKAE